MIVMPRRLAIQVCLAIFGIQFTDKAAIQRIPVAYQFRTNDSLRVRLAGDLIHKGSHKMGSTNPTEEVSLHIGL